MISVFTLTNINTKIIEDKFKQNFYFSSVGYIKLSHSLVHKK